MKTRHSLKLITLFLAFILHSNIFAQEFAITAPKKVGMSSERLEYLTSTFQEYMDNEELLGAVVLIARRGQIGYFKTFGQSDIKNNIPWKRIRFFVLHRKQNPS
jgi:CubicO group peptidase (beta-lactamase class C family)